MKELFPEYEKRSDGPPPPLADRMRPESWQDLLGHEHLIGEKSPLRHLIEKDAGLSFILWGPPGAGKTTIARIVARITQSEFHEISAVNAGVADIRKIIERAKGSWAQSQRQTILFIISSLIYVGLVLVLGARPMYVHFTQRYLGGAENLEVMSFYALVIALSFYVAIEPMRRGIRALKTMDF